MGSNSGYGWYTGNADDSWSNSDPVRYDQVLYDATHPLADTMDSAKVLSDALKRYGYVRDKSPNYASSVVDPVLEYLGLNEEPSDEEVPENPSYGGGFSGSVTSGYDSYLDMLHSEQERVWAREDTYYQRAVKDMQAAGLNPVLAVSHGVSGGGSSASSDSQVVGAVADLAAMAISGLTETAKGIGSISAMSKDPTFFQKIGSWYSKNAKTIQTGVSTAAAAAKLVALIAAA